MIPPFTSTRLTSQFGSEVYDEHFNNIWQHNVGKQIWSLVDEKFRYSNILGSLTSSIDSINISYIRHSRLWMNFALKNGKNFVFSACHAGVRSLWNEGAGSRFGNSIGIIITSNILSKVYCVIQIFLSLIVLVMFIVNLIKVLVIHFIYTQYSWNCFATNW